MWDKIKTADRNVLAGACVALAVVFFLAFNALVNTALTGTRLDLTEDRLYTLSDGTRDLLGSLDEPIDLRLYYSQRLDEIGPDIARHAERVRELLAEYERLSDGKIRLKYFDPEPFSPEEDLAVSDGLQGLPFDQSGARVYFGLAGSNTTDDVDAIAYLAAERSPFLEYDLTRLIYNLANPEKTVVGVLTDLPMQGTQFDNYQPWLIVDSMQQFFDVKFIDRDAKELPENMSVLVIAASHFIDDPLLYAIDQFVLKGGRVLAFVDPLAETMALAGPQGGQPPPPGVGQAALEPLLEPWGVTVDRGKFVANADDAIRVGFEDPETGQTIAVDYVAWQTLQGNRFNTEDTLTAQLQRIVMSSAGAFFPAEGATTTFEPLIFTTPNSTEMDAFLIAQQPNPIQLRKDFKSEDKSFNLAARVTGPVKSAFPDGPPQKVLDEAEDAEAVKAAHVAESARPISVVLVGDADMLSDRNWAQVQQIGGQRMAIPTANNADFAVNAVDNLQGSEALVGLRGRGLSVRPFDIIDEMRREADEKFRAKEQELLAAIERTEENIERMQQEEQTTGVLLTGQQQREIDNLRTSMLDQRRELREVQHSLRQDVQSLETRIRVINIWAVPVVIAIFAVALAVMRRARRARFHRAALH